MVEDRLSVSLLNAGYHRIDSNAQGIYLFYHVEENELEIISVIHVITGNEFTTLQYKHILEQIKANFRASYPNRLHLLSLVFTMDPGRAKLLFTETGEDSHWIIDMGVNRLMIYENQTRDFTWLRGLIEQLLSEGQYSAGGQYPSEGQYSSGGQDFYERPAGSRTAGTGNTKVPNRVRFTLINTSVILLNLLIFLITQYTPAFGGKGVSVDKGALSWYFIREDGEYYRFLSSMFLHAGWDHLINNMIVLLFVGSYLERAAGRLKYLFIYFGSGIVAGICSISYNMWKEYGHAGYQNMTSSIGASGAIFGVVGAILFIVIINKGRLEEISTVQMILFVVLSLYSGIINAQIDQAAHIGGFAAGILFAAILYRRPKKTGRTGNEEIQEV